MGEIIPSIGRIVHYRLPSGRNVGEYRPAVITRVWDDPATPESPVNLQVFTDGMNDAEGGTHRGEPLLFPPPAFWVDNVSFGDGLGQYRWPAIVPPLALDVASEHPVFRRLRPNDIDETHQPATGTPAPTGAE